MTPLFPILAISAAAFIMFLYGRVRTWKPQTSRQLKLTDSKKFAAASFIVIIVVAVAYSGYNAYQMTVRDQLHLPIKKATAYLAGHLDSNQSAVLVCSFNLLEPRYVPLLFAN